MQERIRETGEQACLDLGLQNVHPDRSPVHRPPALPDQLRPEPADPLAGGRRPWRACIASELGPGPAAGAALRLPARHRQGRRPRGGGAARGDRRRGCCKKYGESDIVLNAVGRAPPGLRGRLRPTRSSRRPRTPSRRRGRARGARASSRTSKRLENLEQIAESFAGVEKSYAIQAGREIRILVDHTQGVRRRGGAAGRGDQPAHRGRTGVPGPDQDHGHPRDAGHGGGPLGPAPAGRETVRQVDTVCSGAPVRDAVLAGPEASKVAGGAAAARSGGGPGRATIRPRASTCATRRRAARRSASTT